MQVTVDLGPIKDLCFVVMPFQPRFDLVYQDVYSPAIQDAGLIPVRGDEIYGARRVMQDVWDGIRSSRIVLAEVTGRNGNVLYELGLAHAIGKAVIIVTNTIDDVPFDLKDVRCIVYETYNPRWGDNLRTRITETIRNQLADTSSGPLMSGIRLGDDYPVFEEKKIERPAPKAEVDVSGNWICYESWAQVEEKTRQTTMELKQDGVKLTGKAHTVGYKDPSADRPTFLVEQTLTGSLTERRIQLVATNFEVAQSDYPLEDWSLDTWSGAMDKSDVITGELADSRGSVGTFVMQRI
jgi:hypothetical protein